MKKIFNIILSATLLLAFSPFAISQVTKADDEEEFGEFSIKGQIQDTYYAEGNPKRIINFPKPNGVQGNTDFAYSKDISAPFSDGTYWIKLESYSTGAASRIESAAPADIVLVLDISSSMYENRGTTRDYYLDVAYNNNNVRNNTVFSYSSMNDTDYYYQVGDTRYPVRRERYPNQGQNRRYYLYYFEDANGNNTEDNGENRYYLNVDGTVVATPNQRPAGVTQQGGQLFSGTLVHYRTQQRIDALKKAVKDFIDVIDHNDQYDDDDNLRVDDEGNPERLGNRISIVTFAAAEHVDVLNSLGNGYLGNGSADELKAKVDGMRLYSGTRQALGLDEAYNQLDSYIDDVRRELASRTVVLFTDGEPYFGNTSVNILYNDGVVSAKNIKDQDATVFTVGVFSSSPVAYEDALWYFMQYMSSNAPNATGRTEPGDDFDPDGGYYKDASDPNMDLSAVFTEIAHQSGGSKTSLSAASSNVDVVSNSFVLPADVNAGNVAQKVKIFIAKVNNTATKENNGKLVFYEEYIKGKLPSDWTYLKLDEDGEVIPDQDPIMADYGITIELVDINGNPGIKVKGFDYSSCFCGPIYVDGWNPEGHTDAENLAKVDHYQGYKIIIMIPIKANQDAVGGPNVDTNAPGSGIFITDGDETAFVGYNSPSVSLPYNFFITKEGLQPGESAKFKLERAGLNKYYVDVEKQQLPDGWTPESIPEIEWNYVSTVFLTQPENASASNEPLVKVRGLPSTSEAEGDYIYRISEETWSWSYQRDIPQYTDKSKVDNPFYFENDKKEDIDLKVRHAESKATNIFNGVTNNVEYDDSKKGNVRSN